MMLGGLLWILTYLVEILIGLTLTPFAFIPAIIVTIPLEAVAPEYMIADLPFPVVGLVLATVGYAVLRGRGGAKETTN